MAHFSSVAVAQFSIVVDTFDQFGISVAISGETLVVGAFGEDSASIGVNSTPDEGAPVSGAAYVFTRRGATWIQQAYLKASNTGAGDNFGNSVAISGETIVVGAPFEASASTGVNSAPNEGAPGSGAAYVFTRTGGATWSQQAYLKASNTGANDEFGFSVAISEETIVVGADRENSGTTGVNSTPDPGAFTFRSGAAYIYNVANAAPTDVQPIPVNSTVALLILTLFTGLLGLLQLKLSLRRS